MIAWSSAFGLGILYFVAAIPVGTSMGLNPWNAALAAWSGYTMITAVALAAGTPLRRWFCRRFKIGDTPDPKKLFWRIWNRWGLPGLAITAPVLTGPYIAAFLAIGLGCRPARTFLWIAGASIPWCVLFVLLVKAGVQIVGAEP